MPQATEDIDYEIVLIANKPYTAKFEQMLKTQPKLFFDLETDSNKTIDLSRHARKYRISENSARIPKPEGSNRMAYRTLQK